MDNEKLKSVLKAVRLLLLILDRNADLELLDLDCVEKDLIDKENMILAVSFTNTDAHEH